MSKLNQSFVKTVVAPGRYADGRGLFLRVGAGGGKSWVLRYQVDKRRHDLGLGAYPAVSLKSARLAADTLRLGLSQGIDPLAQREAERREARQAGSVTFRVEAERYIATHRPSWKNPRHAQLWSHSLRDHVYPLLGDVSVEAVDTDLVLQVLAPIWRQIPETAFRLRNRIELVLDAAKARQLRSGENPARWRGHLDKLLPRQNRSQAPFAAMPAEQLGAFVRRLDSLDSTAARACELLIHTACRSSEVCEARWSEFDLASRVWTLDATRMKGGKPHRVPLTDAALQVLEQQRGQHHSHVFPNARRSGALPGNALRRVMASLQASEYVPHGFRSTFRTWAAESTDFPRDVCEMALAHSLGDKVAAAYHRGDLLEKRRQLMQAWSTFIEDGTRLPFSPEDLAD